MGIVEVSGDRRMGVEGTTMGSENRCDRRVGGVLGPTGKQDKLCGV